jgi:hypothetical protein
VCFEAINHIGAIPDRTWFRSSVSRRLRIWLGPRLGSDAEVRFLDDLGGGTLLCEASSPMTGSALRSWFGIIVFCPLAQSSRRSWRPLSTWRSDRSQRWIGGTSVLFDLAMPPASSYCRDGIRGAIGFAGLKLNPGPRFAHCSLNHDCGGSTSNR